MFICIPTSFIGKHPVMIQSSFAAWGSREGGQQTCTLFLIREPNTFMSNMSTASMFKARKRTRYAALSDHSSHKCQVTGIVLGKTNIKPQQRTTTGKNSWQELAYHELSTNVSIN